MTLFLRLYARFALWRTLRRRRAMAERLTLRMFALRDRHGLYLQQADGGTVLFAKYGEALMKRQKGESVVRVAVDPRKLKRG